MTEFREPDPGEIHDAMILANEPVIHGLLAAAERLKPHWPGALIVVIGTPPGEARPRVALYPQTPAAVERIASGAGSDRADAELGAVLRLPVEPIPGLRALRVITVLGDGTWRVAVLYAAPPPDPQAAPS